MALIPEEWNVVVLGRWNPALFTPAAITTRVFGLEPNTPVEVYVPLDDILPPKVKHGGLTVTASQASLIIGTESCRFSELERARQIARNAIDALPRTPMSAVGVNVRYRGTELPPSLLGRFSTDLDERFSDADFQILGRAFRRDLAFKVGRIGVFVNNHTESQPEIVMNFEARSALPETLVAWLDIPIDDIRAAVHGILEQVLELREAEYVAER